MLQPIQLLNPNIQLPITKGLKIGDWVFVIGYLDLQRVESGAMYKSDSTRVSPITVL